METPISLVSFGKVDQVQRLWLRQLLKLWSAMQVDHGLPLPHGKWPKGHPQRVDSFSGCWMGRPFKPLGLWSSSQRKIKQVTKAWWVSTGCQRQFPWETHRHMYNSSTFKTWKRQWSPKEVPAQSKSRVVKRKILGTGSSPTPFQKLIWCIRKNVVSLTMFG